MISAAILLTVLVQAPAPEGSWAESGYDPDRPDAVVVSGTAELSRLEAHDAAILEATDAVRFKLQRRGRDFLQAKKPIWLPGLVGDQILEQWLADPRLDDAFRVVGQRTTERDHGFGKSFQTHLLIEGDDGQIGRLVRSLGTRLRNGAELFLFKCGGSVLLWGICALMFLWLDRLTKGYMTGRLVALFAGMGVSLPVIAFLLV